MITLKKIILLLACVSLALPVSAKTIVEEGFIVDGVEGLVRKVEKADVWNFVPATKITTPKATLPANDPISLLPCSTLEQITSLAGDNNEVRIRLWAMFTEYDRNNYLLSVYFLPISSDAEVKPAKSDESTGKKEANVKANEAKDEEDSIIPTDILKQIKSTKTPDLEKFQRIAKVTGDSNLIGRAGYLKKEGKVRYFQPNAFGYKVDTSKYILLPCGTLESSEKKMDKSPGRQRYEVSGLVTVYKGRQYLLLRRTVRTYSNGNFTN
ncbi:MAG: hypothetical protein H8E62_09515 [Planctomycetes bacterium]|nr:hypothetical protein [Planctomycetota bacterium]